MTKTPREDLVQSSTFRPNRDLSPALKPSQVFVGSKEADHVATRSITYGLDGSVLLDGSEAAARVDTAAGRTTYHIRFGTAGNDRNKILNPLGLYFDRNGFVAGRKVRGRLAYEFREVDKVVFQHYLTYLQTRSEGSLIEAERSYIHG